MVDRIEAGKYSELPEDEIRTVEHDEEKIVFYKHNETIIAHQCKCPHVGAPLDKGRIQHDRLYCMAHHAAFKLETGHNIEPPALDDLQTYQVDIENNTIFIHTEPKDQAFPKDVKAQSSPTFVILGSGPAGATAAETLRRHDFKGRIVLVSSEGKLPYDRTRLSKAVIEKPDAEIDQPLRSDEFYDTLDIQRLTATATKLNLDEKTIELDNGETCQFDKLLIATGSSPNLPKMPGIQLPDIHTLRTPDDAKAISNAAQSAKTAVVIGASFIGLECASGLVARGIKVQVVEQLPTPFNKTLGSALGKRLQVLHEENGITFHLSTTVSAFHGEENVSQVEMEDGSKLDADLVILGLGVHPNTDFLKDTIELNDDGGITVNAHMALPDYDDTIFAAGDIAAFSWPTQNDPKAMFEHWRPAMQTGQRAALSMLGRPSSEPVVPFFWTRQHKFTLRYIGRTSDPEDSNTHGDINSKDFRHNYYHDRELRAVAASRNDQEMIAIHEAFRTGQIPHYAALQSEKYTWLS